VRSGPRTQSACAYNDRMHTQAHLGVKRQFRLRGLLVVVAAAGVLLSIMAARWREQQAVAALLAGNPNAAIHFGDGRTGPESNRRPTWSGTLRNWLALAGLKRVAAVELTYPTDDDVHRVGRLGGVETLRLERALDLSDKGISDIARLPHLRSLEIEGADYLTDRGLAALEQATTLERLVLDVRGRGLSRAGIERLKQALPDCRIEVSDPALGSSSPTTSAQTSRPKPGHPRHP
jgi:hypothetical protein